jgi:hypothetical protein
MILETRLSVRQRPQPGRDQLWPRNRDPGRQTGTQLNPASYEEMVTNDIGRSAPELGSRNPRGPVLSAQTAGPFCSSFRRR